MRVTMANMADTNEHVIREKKKLKSTHSHFLIFSLLPVFHYSVLFVVVRCALHNRYLHESLLNGSSQSLIIFTIASNQMTISQTRKQATCWVSLCWLLGIATSFSPRATHIHKATTSRLWQTATPTIAASSVTPFLDTFVQAWNNCDDYSLLNLLDDEITWQDTRFHYQPVTGKVAVASWLQQNPLPLELTVMDAVEVDTDIAFSYQNEADRGAVWMKRQDNRITSLQWIPEPFPKKGTDSLKLLARVNQLISTGIASVSTENTNNDDPALSLPEQYYQSWNRNEDASHLFADNIVYDDTAFPQPLRGKKELMQHLEVCRQALSFTQFVVDDVVDRGTTTMVRWHVNNKSSNQPLPFTNGISIYQIDVEKNQILSGLDFVDSQPIKSVAFYPFLQEPQRWIPFTAWLLYMYVVFLSDGILPGANALALEQRTWEEVFGLSLNFAFVSPLLHLPFSPSVHPFLEAVFNGLLVYAGLFAGFLVEDDEKAGKGLSYGPIVVGMQFLTSAFLLPYLAFRPRSSKKVPTELSFFTKSIGEAKWWGPAMTGIFVMALGWAAFGRVDEIQYGVDFASRYQTFVDLLSIDRVGSSFLVDYVIFALFQGWLVEDDWKRRSTDETTGNKLVFFAKYVPFFGLASYLTWRPHLLERRDVTTK